MDQDKLRTNCKLKSNNVIKNFTIFLPNDLYAEVCQLVRLQGLFKKRRYKKEIKLLGCLF